MTASIVKALMTADPGRTMFVYPVGDMMAEHVTPGGLSFYQDGVGSYVTVMDEMLKCIPRHRVFDVSSIWEDVWKSLPQHDGIDFGWNFEHCVSLPAYRDAPPFASPPRIGIEGLYVLSDDEAVLVMQEGHPDAHSVVLLSLDPDGDIAANGGVVVVADGEHWQCQVQYRPLHPAAVRVMHQMGQDRWNRAALEFKAPASDGGTFDYYDLVTKALLRASTVLMINTLVQADPTVMQTEVTPKPIIKANAKRGKRTPRAKSWLDLKGVTYNKRTGSWSGHRASTGVSWHQVRGHWRELRSERYTHKRGARIWIKPHTQGTLPAPQPGYRAGRSLLRQTDPTS